MSDFYEKYAAVPFFIMGAVGCLIIAIAIAAVAGAVGYFFGAGFWTPALGAGGLAAVVTGARFVKAIK
jgi:hypothetical protein